MAKRSGVLSGVCLAGCAAGPAREREDLTISFDPTGRGMAFQHGRCGVYAFVGDELFLDLEGHRRVGESPGRPAGDGRPAHLGRPRPRRRRPHERRPLVSGGCERARRLWSHPPARGQAARGEPVVRSGQWRAADLGARWRHRAGAARPLGPSPRAGPRRPRLERRFDAHAVELTQDARVFDIPREFDRSGLAPLVRDLCAAGALLSVRAPEALRRYSAERLASASGRAERLSVEILRADLALLDGDVEAYADPVQRALLPRVVELIEELPRPCPEDAHTMLLAAVLAQLDPLARDTVRHRLREDTRAALRRDLAALSGTALDGWADRLANALRAAAQPVTNGWRRGDE